MYAFTTYVAAWLSDILVDSSTGTRPNLTFLSEVTRTSAVRLVTTRELTLVCFKATQYTTTHMFSNVVIMTLNYLLCPISVQNL